MASGILMKDTILVIAGGPTVNDLDLDLASKFRTIAVNNAYKIAPWAEEMFWGDLRWWEWNGEHLMSCGFKGDMVTSYPRKDLPTYVKTVTNTGDTNKIDDPECVIAPDSGLKSICRAYHRGAKTILLAGFDMQAGPNGETHYHDEHKDTNGPTQWASWSEIHGRIYNMLRQRGVAIYRVTDPGVEHAEYRPLETFYACDENLFAGGIESGA